jgi:alpha-tubulin suppressor-like RCC1 family protein
VGFSTTAAVKTDGTLWTWGSGVGGALGDGSYITTRSIPGNTIGGGTNWKQVAMSSSAGAAVKTDGTLWTWGYGQFGQLGDSAGATTSRSSPAMVSGGGTSWKSVSASQRHFAANVDISF